MISVIIPTFNRQELILRAVKSVLQQSHQDLEIIVVDDGSTDSTEDVINGIGNDKVVYERLSQNRGVHEARNRGIELARGDFIVFLDSDDELMPLALEKLLSITNTDPAIGIVSAPFLTDDGELTGFNRASGYVPFNELLCGTSSRRKKQGASLIKKKVIGELRWAMPNLDFIFFRRVAYRTVLYYVSEPMGYYHNAGSHSTLSRSRRIPNVDLSIGRAAAIDEFLVEFGEELLSGCPKKYATYAYGAAVGLILAGKVSRARCYLKRALKFWPGRTRYTAMLIVSYLPASTYLLKATFSFFRPLSLRSLRGEEIKDRPL